MQNSPSPHAQFFASLRYLEKRLRLEESHPAGLSTLSQPPPTGSEQTSLGTPIYLNDEESPITNTESEAPPEFLSRSADLSPPRQVQERVAERLNVDDDIEVLMQLLRLWECEGLNEKAGADEAFYGKIVGVKGPKSGKELERLEGWINGYLNGGKKVEPFRLAHLLLGKAAFMHSHDDAFEGLVFPSTIDDFLHNEPSTH